MSSPSNATASPRTQPRRLCSHIVAKGFRQWSPDGRRIALAARVDGDIEIFTVDVADGRLTRLTNSPGDDRDPTWSPDGSQIAFSSVRDGNTEIYVMRADGTGLRRVTNDPAEDVSPAWSPDGSTIAFASGVGEDRDLFVIRLADGRRQRLTTGARVTKDVSRWSPDRAYVAIQTADKGNYDIQLVRMVDHVGPRSPRRPVTTGSSAGHPMAGGSRSFLIEMATTLCM